MAVDYADKTQHGENPKPWAIRNIKLVFSRKLIYASGIFSIALTADRTRDSKIETLNALFKMPAIERVKFICGDSASRLAEMYDFFLTQIGDEKVREHLNSLHRDQLFLRCDDERAMLKQEFKYVCAKKRRCLRSMKETISRKIFRF
jgi:hypothetical protein